jgi:prepilin-type N-terminal cleavage/methylation domain-containing protein
MTRATRTPARSGMTLIEILVVLSIIAVLLALSGAGLQKTRISAQFSRTNESVNKLQKSLVAELERVNDNARAAAERRDPPNYDVILNYCDGEQRRARSLYVAMEQRRYFPQTFVEATTPTYIVQSRTTGALGLRVGGYNAATESPVYAHPVSATFADVRGLTAANATDESGVLLYIIIQSQSVAGGGAMVSAGDDLSSALKVEVQLNGANRPGATLMAFKDGFDRPIGFRRWDNGAEAQDSTYVDAKTNFKDPLDPEGYVSNWNSAKRTEAQSQLQFLPVGPNQNRITTVYSLGKDLADPKDDVIGFRTHRAGKKGH